MGTSVPASEPAAARRPLSPWGFLSIGFLLPGWLCLTTCAGALLLGQLARQASGVPIKWLIAGLLALLWAFPLLGATVLMRRTGWSGLKPFGLGLALAAAYALAAAAIRTLAGEDRMLEAALRLGGLALLCLGCGVWALRSTSRRCLARLVTGGLSVPGLAGLATAAAVVGLLTVGWPLTGALGDVVTSVVLLIHTLAVVLPEEILFRGLILGRLLREQPRQWLAAGLGLAVYAIVIPTMILPDANWDQLVWLLVLLPLAVLTTQLRLLTGNVWAGVVVAWLFRAMPRLFTDTRDDLMEPTQALAWVTMVGGALAVAALLWLVRRFGRRRGANLRPAALVVSGVLAVVIWAGWTSAWVWAGVPGFHNDGFIVVMEQRADLSAAGGIRDLLARRAYVYQTLVATAETTQAPIRARLEEKGLSYQAYYLHNMIRVDGYHWRRWEFAGLPGVAAVIVNPNVRSYPVHSQPLGILPDGGAGDTVQWNLHQVGADAVWDMGYRGQGVVVAGQDSGYDWQHPALRSSYRGWDEKTGQADHTYNWHDVWDGSVEPFDEDGHGTHTLGIIVGDDEAGNRVGVAPGARWIGCRNMRRGIGNPAAYLECMQFFLAPYPPGGDPFRDGDVSRAPDVVNNSWGCPDSEGCQADTLQGAVEALRAAGIMVVASAGNDGPSCDTVLDPIARYASAFTVGATTRGETIAYFSSRGPVPLPNDSQLLKPDVVAPGDNVRSSTPGGGYGTASGTSMAGPHVVGVVALLWSARPELIGDVEATEDILRRSATPVEVQPACERPSGRPAKRGLIAEIADAIAYAGAAPTCACGSVAGVPNNVYGWGLVNAQEAVQMAIGSGEVNK